MGIHVGGIYVETKDRISQKNVADFVRDYWLELGAKESKQDPLEFGTLSLEKTGLLGFAVGPTEQDQHGQKWIGIYDSERYRADPALARALAVHFGLDVWFYQITDSVNQAYAKKYGKKEEVINNYGKALDKAESFPYALLYFNQLKDVPDRKELNDLIFLSFENVPFRSKAQYSGPSPQRLKTNQLILKAREYVKTKNADELIKLSNNFDVYHEVVASAVEYTEPTNAKDLDFVYKLGSITIQKNRSYCSVAEAALRMKDEKMFERAIDAIPKYGLYTLGSRASKINKSEKYLAFRLTEAELFKKFYEDPRELNNAIYYLNNVVEHPGISSKRLESLLNHAFDKGPVNPYIFHNLACVHVILKNYDKALQCVADSVKYGYDLIDKIKYDPDLKPIQSDPRFKAAFETKHSFTSFEHLNVSRSFRKKEIIWIKPTIAMHLYFKNDNGRVAAADILNGLLKEFPKMFSHYLKRNQINLSPTPKGRVTRDINLLLKGGEKYGYTIYYNSMVKGAASDLRFYLDLSPRRPGEISVHLPLDIANDPNALYERFVGYASKLPFQTGNAGYSFSVYYEHNGCPAMGDLYRLLQSHLGFTTSQAALHKMVNIKYVIPNWLTFLGPEMAQKMNLKNFPNQSMRILPHNGVVVKAAPKPFVGLTTNPNDLGLFPNIVEVLKPLLPKAAGNDHYLNTEIQRLEKIRQL